MFRVQRQCNAFFQLNVQQGVEHSPSFPTSSHDVLVYIHTLSAAFTALAAAARAFLTDGLTFLESF
jgi:hypothetical protein